MLRALNYSESTRIQSVDVRWLVFFTLAYMSFFIPAQYAVPSGVYRLWQVAMCFFSATGLIAFLSKEKLGVVWVCFTLFFLCYYGLSSVVSAADREGLSIVLAMVKGVGFVSLTGYGLSKRRRWCIAGFALGGSLICLVDLYTVYAYHDIVGGMQHGVRDYRGWTTGQNWFFLSSDNGTFFYFMPTICACVYYSITYSSRVLLPSLMLLLVTTWMYIFLWSAGAMTMMLLYTVIVFVSLAVWGKKGDNARLPTSTSLIAIALLFASAFVIFVQVPLIQDVVAQYGKTSTVGERIGIWDRAITQFLGHPIFGLGFNSEATVISALGINHVHNVTLQVLYQGGLLSLILLFIGIFFACKKADKHGKSFTIFLVATSFSLTIVAGTVDFYVHFTPLFFPILLLGFSGGDDPLAGARLQSARVISE